jgi:hypothetical protein
LNTASPPSRRDSAASWPGLASPIGPRCCTAGARSGQGPRLRAGTGRLRVRQCEGMMVRRRGTPGLGGVEEPTAVNVKRVG